MPQLPVPSLADCFQPGFQLPPFKPSAWYNPILDWFFYLGRAGIYVAVSTPDPHMQLLMSSGRGEVIGIKILAFSQLPRHLRRKFIDYAEVDLDDIRGIEALWILNFEEMKDEIFAGQKSFFKELRRRENFYKHEALHVPGFITDIRTHHERRMTHLATLNQNRLP